METGRETEAPEEYFLLSLTQRTNQITPPKPRSPSQIWFLRGSFTGPIRTAKHVQGRSMINSMRHPGGQRRCGPPLIYHPYPQLVLLLVHALLLHILHLHLQLVLLLNRVHIHLLLLLQQPGVDREIYLRTSSTQNRYWTRRPPPSY